MPVYPGNAAALLLQWPRHVAGGAADVQNARVGRDPLEGKRVWTFKRELRLIQRVQYAARSEIVFSIIQDAEVLRSRQQRRLDDVPRVPNPVHVTDLVAVIGRD